MKIANLFKWIWVSFALLAMQTIHANSVFQAESTTLVGRWDLTIAKDGKLLPSWLEVQHSGSHTLIGRFVYAFGSARPIAEVKENNHHFYFSIPIQWEPGNAYLVFEGDYASDKITGTMVYTDGKTYPFTGERAPSLLRTKTTVWGTPVQLIGKSDMNLWKSIGENQWKVINGILASTKSGSNLVTKKTYNDFKLHVEFRYPKGSNSGVYLRGRYEIQIVDSKGMEPWNDQFSAVYGFLPPNRMVAKNAGEWQSYDITLIGRNVTVVANGFTVISLSTIPGITGGAIDSKEGEPGPILIQGDHGPIEFRNIIITPAK